MLGKTSALIECISMIPQFFSHPSRAKQEENQMGKGCKTRVGLRVRERDSLRVKDESLEECD